MRVLMVGVHKSTKGGMWTVVDNYLKDDKFCKKYQLKYIATAKSGSALKRLTYSIWGIIKVLFFTLFNDYDILHVHMSERMSVFRKGVVMKIAKLRKAKIIVHMHGAEFEDWYKGLSAKKQLKVRAILNSASKIIILGNYWKKFISSLLEDKSKVDVVYNAVSCPSDNLYNPNSKNLLFLGSIGKRKGIFDLLEAMKLVKEKDAKVKLLIYGPDTTSGIEEIIKEKHLGDCIEYRGWLKSENKAKLLSGNIVLNILPSYNEGLPMTILETMSYGIPNISTDVAAIPEAINKSNGYLNKPGDYEAIANDILDFLNDGKKRLVMSDRCRKEIFNRFSISKNIEQIEMIYQEIL